MLNYTKGEWRLQEHGLEHLKSGNKSIALIHGPNENISTEQFLANGLLLSAAPDMYGALKQASAYCDLREIGAGDKSIQEIVDTAIAKAEGNIYEQK